MEDLSTGSAILAGTPSVASTPDISSAAATTQAVETNVTPQTSPDAWYKSLGNDELKGYAELRNWKDVDSVVESYKNLETLMGADKAGRGLVLPADDAEPNAWDAVYDRLGRPQKPEDYKLEVPDGMDDSLVGKASEWMHKAGLNAKQAQEIAQGWNEHMQAQVQAQEASYAAKSEAELEGLRQEWGQGYDKNIELARRGTRAAGLSGEELSAIERSLGTKAMMQMFQKIGGSYSEDTFRGSDGASHPFGMSPEAARVKIQMLKSDKSWGAKYLAGDAQAKQEMAQLHSVAYGAK